MKIEQFQMKFAPPRSDINGEYSLNFGKCKGLPILISSLHQPKLLAVWDGIRASLMQEDDDLCLPDMFQCRVVDEDGDSHHFTNFEPAAPESACPSPGKKPGTRPKTRKKTKAEVKEEDRTHKLFRKRVNQYVRELSDDACGGVRYMGDNTKATQLQVKGKWSPLKRAARGQNAIVDMAARLAMIRDVGPVMGMEPHLMNLDVLFGRVGRKMRVNFARELAKTAGGQQLFLFTSKFAKFAPELISCPAWLFDLDICDEIEEEEKEEE